MDEFDIGESLLEEKTIFIESSNESGVKTYFVFLDLPQHLEIFAGSLPVLDVGTEVEYDLLVRNPKNPSAVRKIQGIYKVKERILKWKNLSKRRSGLIQYLEWEKVSV